MSSPEINLSLDLAPFSTHICVEGGTGEMATRRRCHAVRRSVGLAAVLCVEGAHPLPPLVAVARVGAINGR